MDMDKKEFGYIHKVIPDGERKCIWMTGGLISYKLCDRDYQCENCLFDQVMRNEVGLEDKIRESTVYVDEELLASSSSLHINGSAFYHPSHCWVKVESPEKTRLGIDDFIVRLIADVKLIILPQMGTYIDRGGCYAHIIQKNYILPVIAPVAGTVETVNFHLKKDPGAIINDPMGDGWLITMKPENLEDNLRHLLFGRRARVWYEKEEKELIEQINAMQKDDKKDLGVTMQDGGVQISRLRDLLSSEQCSQILDSFISKSTNSKVGKIISDQ